MIHYTAHIGVEQVRHIARHLLDNQHSRIASIFIALSLQEVERTLHLKLDKLVAQRVAAMLRHPTQHTSGRHHDLWIGAREIRLQVLVEAVQTRAIIFALEPDKVIDRRDSAQLAR